MPVSLSIRAVTFPWPSARPLLSRISLTADPARAISNSGGQVKSDCNRVPEHPKEREELMPFLGGIDEDQLSLQLERLDNAALR